MKDELKNILLMGLGAMSLTTDKAKELREELLIKGTKVYNDGKVFNEELKHNAIDKFKENFGGVTKEDVITAIKDMSAEEKKEIMDLLNESSK